ncbi:MAG: hypothetical protein HY040_25000 [Planctomycetes bacterium]|nr:hypothetical protein [Planctomycetota bacterium]
MVRFTLFTLVLALSCIVSSEVLALGADHPKGPVAGNDRWPEGLKELFNRDNRVHGYWVNGEDVFFYSGDTQAFNQFVEAYSKLKNTSLRVVIHPGAKKARSPWDQADRNIPAEWSLYSSIGAQFQTRLDLWLGSRIKLENLKIPRNVEAVSGGEIESFIAERQPRKK